MTVRGSDTGLYPILALCIVIYGVENGLSVDR